MFPSLAARETYVAQTNFAARKQENVFTSGQKHFSFPDTNFAFETYVSQLVTIKVMLTSFQCCSLKMFPSNKVSLFLCACVTPFFFPKQRFLVWPLGQKNILFASR